MYEITWQGSFMIFFMAFLCWNIADHKCSTFLGHLIYKNGCTLEPWMFFFQGESDSYNWIDTFFVLYIRVKMSSSSSSSASSCSSKSNPLLRCKSFYYFFHFFLQMPFWCWLNLKKKCIPPLLSEMQGINGYRDILVSQSLHLKHSHWVTLYINTHFYVIKMGKNCYPLVFMATVSRLSS